MEFVHWISLSFFFPLCSLFILLCYVQNHGAFVFFFIPSHCFLWLFGCFLSIWCIPQFSRSINMKSFEPISGVFFSIFTFFVYSEILYYAFCLLCGTQCMQEYISLPWFYTCRTWMLNNIELHSLNVMFNTCEIDIIVWEHARQCVCVNTTDSSCSRHLRFSVFVLQFHISKVCTYVSMLFFLNRCEHSRKHFYFSYFFHCPSFVRSFFWFNCFESKNSKWFEFLEKKSFKI